MQLPSFPMPLLPGDGSDAPSDDEQLMSGGESGGPFRRTASGHTISPPKGPRSAGPPTQLPGLFQQQAAMQAQQMQAQMQQMQQAQQLLQQQQQHHAHHAQQGFPNAGFGQPPFQ